MKSLRHWLGWLLLVPIGLGLARLRFDVEVLDLLPADVPVVEGLKIYQQNFANAYLFHLYDGKILLLLRVIYSCILHLMKMKCGLLQLQ